MNINEYIASMTDANEKPLDNMISGGGMVGILSTIGCVGDSLSSGEYETVDKNGMHYYYDLYKDSWGQFMARMTGAKVYNFSRGGMTAKHYLELYADSQDFWNPEKKCRAYIIALGVNDVVGGRQTIGSVEDICREDSHKNKLTFAGYYAAIVQRLKEINPDARFFFMTIPEEHNRKEVQDIKDRHAELMYELAEYFDNSYVIDLRKYGPVYDDEFKKKFYLNGHMNTAGYCLTAQMVVSYIDYIIRHNLEAFSEIALNEIDRKNYHL